MQTIKLKYKSCSNNEYIAEKQYQFTGASRYIYKRLELSADSNFITQTQNKFNLNTIELRSIITKMQQVRSSHLNKINEDKIKIESLIIEIIELKEERSSAKSITKIVKLTNEINRLNKSLSKKLRFIKSDIVFGKKSNLQKISKLSNNITNENKEDLVQAKSDYKLARICDIYLVGEANQKGNRFFKFDLTNNKISYTPCKGTKIDFELSRRKNINILKLQELIDKKEISVTVSITATHILLTFDEAILSGYSLNIKERNKEVKEFKNKNKDLPKELVKKEIKDIYKKHYLDLKNLKLKGKIENRFLAIDLNPDYIGYSIVEKKLDNSIKIIKCGAFNFKKVNKKSRQSSTHKESIFRNNKRKHERKEVICTLFTMMKHYGVSTFVIEDLDFTKATPSNIREFNRKVKNIWDRELIINLIKKKCTEGGYTLEPINPAYSSLIGNMTYQVFDPVGASLEIARRGLFKYNKGHFMPKYEPDKNPTLKAIASRLLLDADLCEAGSWHKCHTIVKSLRYRWGESEGYSDSLRHKSLKSRVEHNIYVLPKISVVYGI